MKFALPLLFICLLCISTEVDGQDIVHKNESIDITTLDKETIVNVHTHELNKWDYFVYPVPAIDEINIKVTRGHVMIQQINVVDESGNDVLEVKDLSADKVKVDLADLPPGQYYLQVRPDKDSPLKMKRFYVSN